MMVRVLNRYIGWDFVKSFLLTVLVLTFVMYIGTVVKAIDYMTRGISGLLIMKIFAIQIPFTLTFVIPMSVLTTVLLHFGRLSADGEITAMKASGISLWQIAAPVLFFAVLLSMACLYINSELAPRSHYARRQLASDLGDEDPLALLSEGQFVDDFPGVKIYVGKKVGNRVEDVIFIKFGENYAEFEMKAKVGIAHYDATNRLLRIDLEQVRISEFDETTGAATRTLSADGYPLQLKLDSIIGKKGEVRKKPSDMGFMELVLAIRNIRQVYPDILEENVAPMRTKMAVDATRRLALALACFSFAMLGIPLGIQSSRRESSVGIGLALVVFFLFYLFIIIADALVDKPEWRSDLLPWIPVLGAQIAGAWLMHHRR
jgi:lipopolysaccharide export system permease protein